MEDACYLYLAFSLMTVNNEPLEPGVWNYMVAGPTFQIDYMWHIWSCSENYVQKWVAKLWSAVFYTSW